VKAVDEDLLILSDLELLTCDFYNCVHFLNMFNFSVLFYFLEPFMPTKRIAKIRLFFGLANFFQLLTVNSFKKARF
jgi:hypothetical protein